MLESFGALLALRFEHEEWKQQRITTVIWIYADADDLLNRPIW